MRENQHTEFKESWHDEYTRYISAFCNTEGGVLYIGIDDKGEVVGIEQPKRLIEKLPNFIAQKTGIMPLIHLREKAGKEYLEIEVQPSAMPISVHGRYYTRSGSVTSELQGNQLNMFLAAKMGLTWESVIEEDLSRSHPSRPHNKLIADVFYKAGFMESWGRGTQRIIDNCVAEGLSAPMYEYKMGFLYLTFSHERVNERVNELTDTELSIGSLQISHLLLN